MLEKKPAYLARHLPSLPFVVLLAALIGGLAGAVIYAGVYNIGADAPHTRPAYWLIENVRDRSIAVRARNLAPPPDLADPKRILIGAGLYNEMCSSCHLAPGRNKTEISQGLYPPAPELSRTLAHSPGEEFWMIKHGVKLTAMPAWGRTHNDDLIWDMVAFVQQLPKMSPQQYQEAVNAAPEDHDATMRDMPGMKDMATKPDKPPAKR